MAVRIGASPAHCCPGAGHYPAQIHRILIRNIDNTSAMDLRYKEAFRNIDNSKWQLFDQPGQISVDDLLKTYNL